MYYYTNSKQKEPVNFPTTHVSLITRIASEPDAEWWKKCTNYALELRDKEEYSEAVRIIEMFVLAHIKFYLGISDIHDQNEMGCIDVSILNSLSYYQKLSPSRLFLKIEDVISRHVHIKKIAPKDIVRVI